MNEDDTARWMVDLLAESHFRGIRELLTLNEWRTIAEKQDRCPDCGHLELLHDPSLSEPCLVNRCRCPADN